VGSSLVLLFSMIGSTERSFTDRANHSYSLSGMAKVWMPSMEQETTQCTSTVIGLVSAWGETSMKGVSRCI